MSTRNAFRWCLGIAVLGILGSSGLFAAESGATNNVQIIRGVLFFVFGAGPILAYSNVVRKRLKAGTEPVSEASIDAVYYLGFLITLTTLFSSVVSYGVVNLHGTKNASLNVVFIAISFGLSLTATAFALFERVDLIQMRDVAPSPEGADESLRDRIRASILELDGAHRHLASVMDDASARFAAGLSTNNAALAQQLSTVIGDAGARLKDFVESAARDVSSSQRQLNDASTGAADAISANNAALFKQMSGVIEEARTSLDEFVKAASLKAPSTALADAVADVTASLEKAGRSLAGLFTSLEPLQGSASIAAGNLDKLSASVEFGSQSATAMSEALGRISSGTGALDLEPVRTALGRLQTTIQTLDSVSAAAEQRYATASDGAVRSMQSRTDDLSKATQMLSDAFVKVSTELARTADLFSRHL